MSEKTNNKTEETKVYSPEEIKEMRLKSFQFYQEEIKFLKVQAAYEGLVANVEESKFRKYEAMAKTAQLFAHMSKKSDVPQPKEKKDV